MIGILGEEPSFFSSPHLHRSTITATLKIFTAPLESTTMASAGSSKGLSDRAGPSRGGASIALERALQPTTKRVSARQEDRLIAEVQNILHKEYGLEKERIPGAGIIRVALEGAGWVAAAAVGDLVNAGFIFGSESGEEWECKPAAVVASSQKAPPAAKHLPSALKLRGNTASVGE